MNQPLPTAAAYIAMILGTDVFMNVQIFRLEIVNSFEMENLPDIIGSAKENV